MTKQQFILVYILGICIVGIELGIIIWLLIKMRREQKARKKDNDIFQDKV